MPWHAVAEHTARLRVLHDLFRHLLSLLPAARRNTKGDQSLTTNKAPEDYPLGYWKLTQYFDLLKWCLRGPSEKLIVRIPCPHTRHDQRHDTTHMC